MNLYVSLVVSGDNFSSDYTASSLLVEDTWTGTLSRKVGDIVGTYRILQNTLSAGDNYKIIHVGANLVITEVLSAIVPLNYPIFTGLANATILDLQGKQVWAGLFDIK